ncbi:hypothetical protein C2857_007162 [Epichloe festucae Fl1]|uniref:Myb-like domain-containing protein n=1 Tax=Epichloe festucae (strain Fl1) TaxID=877507 RepID=A0A7S9KM77_EPIFF|nr:hypothetical protein C2857_007162 [Epichloe festucae Fl1]
MGSSAASGARQPRGQPWTQEAKYQLLLRIIAQLREGGKPIDWQKIDLPGRTTKSLQNTWSLIKKSIDEFEERGEGEGSPPSKSATLFAARKKGPSKARAMALEEAQDDDDDDDDVEVPGKSTPRKRGADQMAGHKVKRLKNEPKYDSQEDDIVFKTEPKREDSADEM